MTRFLALITLLCLTVVAHSAESKEEARPNILFLMGDDWSWPHAGALGDPVVKTPAFDRLAREGVLLENAFVSSPSCTPSRMAIVTGQWHWRLKEAANLGGSLAKDVDVYPEMLRSIGYQIGFSRKGAGPSKHVYRGNDPFGPRFKSFTEFLAKRKADEPFCFWYGAGEPHRPYIHGTGERAGLKPGDVKVPTCLPDHPSVRVDLCDYYERIQQFDSDAAKMIKRLEQAGELDNTIVVMSGDNGMPFPRCKATLYDTGTRVPLVIRWGDKIQGGRTIADFVSLCDLAPTFLEAAGLRRPDEMTGHSLLPILRSTKSGTVQPSRDHVLIGMERHVFDNPSRAIRTSDYLYIQNFEPATWPTGRGAGSPPEYDFSKRHWPSGSEAFSFNIDPSPSKQYMLRNQGDTELKSRCAQAFGPRPEAELYDLKKDPHQLHNVANLPDYAAARTELAKKLKAELVASSDPRFVRAAPADAPNVLFIAMDDLNDWIGCMGGHPQTLTPNLDRLAKSGVLFTNAHCPGAACNPSRTAIFTGRSPHRSGLYDNRQKMREVLPDAEILPKTFSRHGYHSSGSGKMLHYFIDAPSWDEYFPEAKSENPFPRTLYPEKRPLSLPRGGPWQYVETDWGPLDATDEEYGGDYLVTKWVSEQLAIERDKPFFLACGIYRPHEPWFVPKKYFKPFPLETIQLPPGYKEDDLDDLPPGGKRRGPNRYFAHIRKQKQWKQGIQGYLASIHFGDAMLGRVLDALEKSPHANNTLVVLWSDHGWHLGEKQHWQKYTAWRACTRVPLIVRVPKQAPGLPSGTVPSKCSRPVNLLSLYPTLLELCGLPDQAHHDGPSLVPLLRDPSSEWPHASVTHLSDPGSFGLSAERWRYIHYAKGDEELYDIESDPHEWTNLAANEQHAAKLAELRALAPKKFAPKPPPSDDSLPKLAWQPQADKPTPPSKPDGKPFDVVFINKSDAPVKLFWMTREGAPKFYADIAPSKRRRQQTRPGAVWLITDANEKPLGHFRVDDRTSRAIVPPIKSGE